MCVTDGVKWDQNSSLVVPNCTVKRTTYDLHLDGAAQKRWIKKQKYYHAVVPNICDIYMENEHETFPSKKCVIKKGDK